MLEIVNLVLGREGFHAVMRSKGSVKPFFEEETYFFCLEPHISIYFTDIKSFFYLDNLEPAPGRPAPELEVKALKIHEIPYSHRTKLTISST